MNSTVYAPMVLFPTISWIAHFALPASHIILDSRITKPLQVHNIILPGPQKVHRKTIPLHHQKGKTLFDLPLAGQHKWRREIGNALQTTYGKSAFFDFYTDGIQHLLAKSETLGDLCLNAISFSLHYLQLDQTVAVISPDEALTKDYPLPHFRHFEPYYQVFGSTLGFIPDLPVYDILCNMGPEAGAFIIRNPPLP
jgi:hypothetical protein